LTGVLEIGFLKMKVDIFEEWEMDPNSYLNG
jgi:hypothetical protein